MLRLVTPLFAVAFLIAALLVPATGPVQAQATEAPPPTIDPQIEALMPEVSSDQLRSYVQAMVDFGTRHTLSDTTSDTRGVGAARRWVRDTFEEISADCGGCLEVGFQRTLVEGGQNPRVPEDTYVYNVVAIQRGTTHPNRYFLIGGHLDSRVSDIMNAESDAPGANDDASGVAGAIEAARVLSQHDFGSSIVYVGFTGEEQGLIGAAHAAQVAREEEWDLAGVLNNDMIGNIEGISGVVENTTFRIFSQRAANLGNRWSERFFGGENDGASRQLARYVATTAERYVTNLNPQLIYRLDRFGRGGDHRPFNDAGFPAVRIMETHENYNRQHQDLRTEDGIRYGDTIDGVDFDYAAQLTRVNVAALASLASAPPRPQNVAIGGAVQPSTTLRWDAVDDPTLAGYRIYWRPTDESHWTHSRFVGDVTEHTLENIVIDNYLFGVAAVGADGHESPVVFPGAMIR